MNAQELEQAAREISADVDEFDEVYVARMLEGLPGNVVRECQGMEPGPFEPPAPAE